MPTKMIPTIKRDWFNRDRRSINLQSEIYLPFFRKSWSDCTTTTRFWQAV